MRTEIESTPKLSVKFEYWKKKNCSIKLLLQVLHGKLRREQGLVLDDLRTSARQPIGFLRCPGALATFT